MKKIFSIFIVSIIAIGIYYLAFPAINNFCTEFWIFITFIFFALSLSCLGCDYADSTLGKPDFSLITKVSCIGTLISFIAMILSITIGVLSAKEYNYKATEIALPFYSLQEVSVKDYNLSNQDISKISGLSNYKKQYKISSSSSIIYNDGEMYVVAPLTFKAGQSGDKIPGYVKMNATTGWIEFVECEISVDLDGILNKNINRITRKQYKSKIFGNYHFEIDDNGHPYYIAPTYEYCDGAFSGCCINGVLMVDAVSGQIREMDFETIPEWIDIVYSNSSAIKQVKAFLNSQSIDDFISSSKINYYGHNDDIYGCVNTNSLNQIYINMRTGQVFYNKQT